MDPSIRLRPPRNSVETRVNEYMKPFHTASCQEHLLGALQQLPRSESFYNEESGIREQVALRLLQEVIVLGAAEQEALDECLVACGPLEGLSACSTTLQGIASRNSKRTKTRKASSSSVESPSILETALRTIRRWLVKGVSFPPHVEGYDERCWVEQIAEAFSTSGSLDPSNPLMEACLQNLTKLVLMLPVQISNACHALGVQLPSWAIASRYNPRLVEGALSMALYQEQHYYHFDTTTSNGFSCCSTAYLQMLVQRMVRNRNPDDAALGLYKYHERHYHGSDDPRQTHPPKALCQMLLRLHRHTLSPRESAHLVRSIMISSIPRQSHATEIATHQLTEIWNKQLYPYIELACRPILVASRKVREAFVRLLVLSPSSVLSEEWPDRLLCHCVASLLANPIRPSSSTKVSKKRRQCAATDDIDDDESDSTSSSESSSERSVGDDDSSSSSQYLDSEDPNERTNHHTWLAKHVQEVVATWSLTVFVRQTDYRLQRHVTHFLLSGMSFLQLQQDVTGATGASPHAPAMSDLISSMMEGVTVRLESSIHEIRKDGMMVAERLAQKMGQELQFEELDQDRIDEEDERTFLNSVIAASEFPAKYYTKALTVAAKKNKPKHTAQPSGSERQPKSKKKETRRRAKEERRRLKQLKQEGKSDTRILDAVYGHVNKKSSRKSRSAQSHEDSYDICYDDDQELFRDDGMDKMQKRIHNQKSQQQQRHPLPPEEQLRHFVRRQQRHQNNHIRPQEHSSFNSSYDDSTEQWTQRQSLPNLSSQHHEQLQSYSSSLRQNPHYQPYHIDQTVHPQQQQDYQEGHQHVRFDNTDYIIPEPTAAEQEMQRKYWQNQWQQQRRQQQYLQQQALQRQHNKAHGEEQEKEALLEKKRQEEITMKIHSPRSTLYTRQEAQPSLSPAKQQRLAVGRDNIRSSSPRRHKPDITVIADEDEYPDKETNLDENEGKYKEVEDDDGIAACWTQHEVEMILEDDFPSSPRRRVLSPRKAVYSPKVEHSPQKITSPRPVTSPRKTHSPQRIKNSPNMHSPSQKALQRCMRSDSPLHPSNVKLQGSPYESRSPVRLSQNSDWRSHSPKKASSPQPRFHEDTFATTRPSEKEKREVPPLIFAMVQDGKQDHEESELLDDSEGMGIGGDMEGSEVIEKTEESDVMEDTKESWKMKKTSATAGRYGRRVPSGEKGKNVIEKVNQQSKKGAAPKRFRQKRGAQSSPSNKPPLSPRLRKTRETTERLLKSKDLSSSLSIETAKHVDVSHRRHPHVDPAEIDARIFAAAYDQESDASTTSAPSLSVYSSSSSEYSAQLDMQEQKEGSLKAIRRRREPFARAYQRMKRKKQMRREPKGELEQGAQRQSSRHVMMVDPDAAHVSDEEDGNDDDNEYEDESGSTDEDNDDEDEDFEVCSRTGETDCDEEDSIWEESNHVHLNAYDIEDDEEDLQEIQRPRYLRDALEFLRTPESDDHACSKHESALIWLPLMVQGEERPADLPDLCIPLAFELLRMENKFNIENFGSRKIIATISLTVEEPLAVGQRLILMLWEDVAFMDRLDVLTVLGEAAFELSGNKQVEAWQKEAAENK